MMICEASFNLGESYKSKRIIDVRVVTEVSVNPIMGEIQGIADLRRWAWISLGENGLGRVFRGGEVQLEGAVVGFWWISQDEGCTGLPGARPG